ncbi:uncharacterized protein AMSG_12100 [Thecamonas trahens ATCC 50062]|uniref:CYTH domain-containing protein n=1 Tax=Thecamonas trahens ATCC 50062 TaxID=461836 RepID=A0A0L0DHJ3_THETB|nr:hypothetical protein AMSG_12100 [Thecamonas trahens ATCC 50062]KNC51685.1 hypothetical protein AMSG_12100 [Thecamonas trahens ATCC 50062]|eukprot:XP_013755901.1 hypothetical protein AMSG_12100 [Thecamonas trahens ATCC 50062]
MSLEWRLWVAATDTAAHAAVLDMVAPLVGVTDDDLDASYPSHLSSPGLERRVDTYYAFAGCEACGVKLRSGTRLEAKILLETGEGGVELWRKVRAPPPASESPAHVALALEDILPEAAAALRNAVELTEKPQSMRIDTVKRRRSASVANAWIELTRVELLSHLGAQLWNGITVAIEARSSGSVLDCAQSLGLARLVDANPSIVMASYPAFIAAQALTEDTGDAPSSSAMVDE